MTQAVEPIPLSQIARAVGAAAPANDAKITGVATLTEAGPSELSFLGSEAFIKQFNATRAAAVLVHKKLKLPEGSGGGAAVLLVDDADLAMARVLDLFSQPAQRPAPGRSVDARIDPTAHIDDSVAIGAFVCIGQHTSIGKKTVIHPQVYIGDHVTIGEGCEIFPNVTLRERIQIGNNVTIHAGSVIGTDGFGYRWDGSKHAKMPHVGTVIIEDDVEIGSCTCIDRAKFSATRIGRGSKIDNLVQIAHNVAIGPHCIIVGQAGLAGSARLGAGVVLGGQVAIRDHVVLGDGSAVAACAAVADDVAPRGIVSGMPALPHRQSLREQAALRRLPDLIVQVRKLQEELEKLRGVEPTE